MRTRINNITFTADTRSIDTGIADLTIEDIKLIVNETQKVVLCSSMQKSLVASINNGVVTYITSYTKVNPNGTTTTVVIPPLAQGDKITFEIDRGTSAEDLKATLDTIKESVGSPVQATEEEYTAFRAHLQDEIDELLTPIEEEESNE